MNSSMLAGERRWGSARRGGMTVLGKVAVPKPLNLPSQRLENHGLDPNVEIVPKGTLSWGSRPSSSGSNPWMSSSLSSNTEGGTVSPSHLSGRPSSGGSGTRPSTAGSERTHEPVANTWGSNSRPSSASGTLSSNQTSSTSLRPRSAENRPNSSQLSRFADPLSKSSAAWGTSGTAERLGVKSINEDRFSPSSGDFPTLGTEKDNSMKNTDLEDAKHGLVNTWRADALQGAEDDIHHPSIEKWHEDPPQYFNPNASPQHFDTWRGAPPMNGPGPAGIWYGGQHPRAPTFGAPPVHPGGFRMEPFPYYRPQIAPPPLSGSQPGPPPGPSGPHPRNGDLYRPQMSDAYTRPGMLFRPGFYPGAPGPPGHMTFEGYYGPPAMGPDMSYMGMSAGPPVYNSSYLSPAPDIGNSHGSNGRSHQASKTSSEQVEDEDTREPRRVTLKTRNQCDQREEGGIREQRAQPDVSYPGKNRLPMIFSRKNEWGAEEDTDEAMYAKRRTPSEKSPHNSEHRGHSADGVEMKLFEGMGNVKAVDDNWTNVSESVPSFPPEMPRVPLGSERDSSLPSMTKNSALMPKIDGLNAKMCVSDGRKDPYSAYNREDIDTKTNKNTGEVGNTAGSVERAPASRDFVSGPNEVIVPVRDKPVPVIAVCRRPHHGGQGRVDHHGKGKFSSRDTDGWRKRPLTAESSSVITASHNESGLSSHTHVPNNVEEAPDISVINPVGKSEGDSTEIHDSSDIQAQRAKMREIAKQRALQREKEEEERTREQRAKALAKLEELNRRTLAGEAGSQKSDKSQITNDIPGEQDESCTFDELVMPDIINAKRAGESAEVSIDLPLEADVSTLPAHEDAHDGNVRKIVSSQYNDSRHKRTGYNKPRQNNSFQKSFTEKSLSNVPHGPQKDHTLVATDEHKLQEHPSSGIRPGESNMPNTFEPPASQRRKSNRSGKNKHKLDETPSPPVMSVVNPGKESIGNIETEDSVANWESSFSTGIEPDRAVQAQEVLCSLLNEESHNRATNQWRPQASRRLPRNQQANNKPHGSDTSVWAPVRTQNKARGSVEASQNSADESANSAKSNINLVQNGLKGKRAEMERYVPKPVTKELVQQVNDPNLSSWIITSRSNDGSSGEVNEGDMGHSKHKKNQGTWKKLGPSDSSHIKNAHIGPSFISKPTKEIQEPKEIGKSVKNEIDHSVKDQGATSREKRNWPKGPATSISNNTEPGKTCSGEIDVNQMDRTKENRTWQPKSSLKTASSQHGNRIESLTMETNRSKKKEHIQQKPQSGQSGSVKSIVAQESNVGHCREFEKKAKGRPYSLNQGQPVGPNELSPPANEDAHVECNIPSRSRKNDRQNTRSFRGHDNNTRGDWSSSGHDNNTRGDGSSSGHDNNPHNAPPFRDSRHRQNLQYEYQPVGPFKGNRPEKVESNDGADNLEQRHWERGQSHSRRGGNFNRRQNGATARLDSGWE